MSNTRKARPINPGSGLRQRPRRDWNKLAQVPGITRRMRLARYLMWRSTKP